MVKKAVEKPPFSVIAHRGASLHAPENTLQSFLLAKQNGAQCVEFDVQLTKDLVPIVLHDHTLDRTTNGSGLVNEHSYHAIKTLDAGSWFQSGGEPQRIPTLLEAIYALNTLNLQACVEIKQYTTNIIDATELILNTVRESWSNPKLPVISSFNILCLEHALLHSPQYPRGLLLNDWTTKWHVLARKVQCSGLHLNHELLTTSRIHTIKNAGYLIYAYTVNDPVRAKKLQSWGIDGIYSDDTSLLPMFSL